MQKKKKKKSERKRLDQILGQSFKSDPIKKDWTAIVDIEPIWEVLHLGLVGWASLSTKTLLYKPAAIAAVRDEVTLLRLCKQSLVWGSTFSLMLCQQPTRMIFFFFKLGYIFLKGGCLNLFGYGYGQCFPLCYLIIFSTAQSQCLFLKYTFF